MHSSPANRSAGVQKPRDVKAGEVALYCEPWVSVVYWNERSRVCAYCWKQPAKVNACTGCRYSYYCDQTCQKLDWKREHKYLCELIQADQHMPKCAEDDEDGLMMLCKKVVCRYTMPVTEKHPGLNGMTPKDYMAQDLPRLQIEQKPFSSRNTGRNLHQAFKHDKQNPILMMLPITNEQYNHVYRNILASAMEIKDDTHDAIRKGIFLENTLFRSDCRGNCAYFFSGRNLVVKALVDIPVFATGKVTISPKCHSGEVFTRAERQRHYGVISAQVRPGRKSRAVPAYDCPSVHCDDKYEAEVNSLKCSTVSCMEPIPSDKRANEPCRQCGATNPGLLAKGLTAMKRYTKQMLDAKSACNCPKYCSPTCLSKTMEKKALLLTELESSQNPFYNMINMIIVSLAHAVVNGLEYTDRFPEALHIYEKYFDVMENYFLRHSTVEPEYVKFLALGARIGDAVVEARKSTLEVKNRDFKAACSEAAGVLVRGKRYAKEMIRCLEMSKKWRTVPENLCN